MKFLHTLDLAQGNRTTDAEINDLSMRESRVVVTKDSDFVDSHILRREPEKLLLIATGNISNQQLDVLLLSNIDRIVLALESHDYVELSRTVVVLHA